jgi:RNA polymerase sigma factor (sigma-70 family)
MLDYRPREPDGDEQLIRGIRQGGIPRERALQEVNRNPQANQAVRRMVYANGGQDDSDVQSTFNEGLLALNTKVERLREEEIPHFKLWAYLLVACRFCWYKERRNRQRMLKRMKRLFENLMRGNARPGRYLSATDKQHLELVEGLIDELPEDNRLILLMHEMGYTYAEIGEALDLSETNTKTRAHRIKKRLLDQLNDQFPDVL